MKKKTNKFYITVGRVMKKRFMFGKESQERTCSEKSEKASWRRRSSANKDLGTREG